MAKPTRQRNTPKPSTNIKPTSISAPEPFTPAPQNLAPFLSILSKSSVYITHIDTLPRAYKRHIFIIPTLLNGSILALLLWRAYAVLPVYVALFFSILGLSEAVGTPSTTLDVENTPWGILLRTGVGRGAMFFADYLLVRFAWAWPVTFFAAPGNPCLWRWRVGFRDEEAVVRVSKDWGREELLENTAKGPDNLLFKVKVLPAVKEEVVRKKTGYLLQDRHWDLDFAAMTRAHGMVDKGEVPMKSFRKMVLVWVNEEVGWCAWEVWRIDEGLVAREEGERSGREVDARKKAVEMRERLARMGKEDLFFRWIEIVQFYSEVEGGFTKERQEAAVRDVTELFNENGVDFEGIMREVGGFVEDME